MRKSLFILLFLACTLCLSAQVYSTRIFHPSVRTLRVQMLSDWERKQNGERIDPIRPILLLNDGIIDGTDPDNTLEISFDEMSHEVRMYTYTLLHLNADGTASDLVSGEYVHGFTTMDIIESEPSLNTSQLYTHYRFTFPNEDMQITKSGQYALRIYEDGNPDKLVATVCFYAVEPMVGIGGQIRANTNIEYNGRYQQLDIDINTAGLDLRDANEIKMIVQQNGRTDNMVYFPRPSFIEPKRIRYINHADLIFEGGNEYRHFDLFSTYLAGYNVDRIIHDRVDYHAILFQDENLSSRPYIHEFDVNGQYVINAERTEYDDTEAEYMWVHWTLPAAEPWFDGAIYVGGDVFLNRMSAENRMQYDVEHKCYWLTQLVKQGGTDYQYWFVPKNSKKATLQRTEGSHWETQNEYRVFVYYRPFGARADRLVGVQNIR